MGQTERIIQHEGDKSTFIWKHPCERFEPFAKLIVHEGQEVVFFTNGQALDPVGPGQYTLGSQLLPQTSKELSPANDGEMLPRCEVYFINKAEQMAIKWGTDSRVQYLEPTYRFPISIGASGEMSLRVGDSRKLMQKLVGTENLLGQQKLAPFFRAFLMTRVKTYIAQYMRNNAVSIFEIDGHLTEFSEALHAQLTPDFADYGISLERFFVTTVVRPDGDWQYERFKDLHFRQYADIAEAELRQQTDLIQAQTEAQKVIIDSQAQATKRAQEGYTYQQERGFDLAQDVARNRSAGQSPNAEPDHAAMAAVGSLIKDTVGAAGNSAGSNARTEIQFCYNCGARLAAGAAFCDECGTAVPAAHTQCAKCGFVFERAGKFCPKCGTKRG